MGEGFFSRVCKLPDVSPVRSQPIAIVLWGGICAGKSTVRATVLDALCINPGPEATAVADQGEMAEQIPEFRAAVRSPSGELKAEMYQYAYLDCAALAKEMLAAYHKFVAARRLNVILELHDAAKLAEILDGKGGAGENWKDYAKVIVFVDQRDRQAAIDREKVRA